MIELKSYTAKTNQGPYLQVNEDDVDVDLRNKLYLLLDGFGGSGVGDKCVREIKESLKKFYTKVGGDPDSTLPFYFSHKYLIEGNALINAMHLAHTFLKKENRHKEMNQRGGASAVCVAQAENILTFALTGNVIALLYRKGRLKTIVEPDNMKLLGHDEHQRHHYSLPLSGFGLFDELHLKVEELRILEEDQVILLSDGVYTRVEEDEIKYVLSKPSEKAVSQIDDLFHLSNQRGNLDNQSALILRF